MKTLAMLVLFSAVLFFPTRNIRAATPEASPAAIYGAYPTNYQEIVTKWLATQLLDAASAKIEWAGPPKATDLPVGQAQHLFGYLVEFKVNARNRFGSYTGRQKHAALVRNGEVVKGVGFGY